MPSNNNSVSKKIQYHMQLQLLHVSYKLFSRIFLKTIFSRLNGISEVEKEVDFLLWTEDNPTEPDKLKVGDVFSLHLSHFKSDLPTKILIHGFEDTGTTGWVLNVRDEYFKKESCNVISVDWRKLSNTYPFYNIAAANTKSVGYLTASLVNFLGQVHAIQFNKNWEIISFFIYRDFFCTL